METAIRLKFADGEYRFWLPVPQVMELERKTGSTMLAIENQLRAAIGVRDKDAADPEFIFLGGGLAPIASVTETLRLALIGGANGTVDGESIDVGPNTALRLVKDYAYPARPFSETAILAWRVLHAAIYGNATEAEPAR